MQHPNHIRVRGPSIWLHLLWLLLASFCASGITLAAAAPSLTLSQECVTIEVGSTTTIVASHVSAPAGDLRFTADRGIKANVRSKGSGYWLISLAAEPALTAEGFVTIELIGKGGRSMAIAQLKVVPKARPAVEAMAQGALVLDGDELVEGRPLRAFLTLANRSDQTLRVGELRPLVPAGVELAADQTPQAIPPRQVGVIPVAIKVSEAAAWAPGKHVLGVAVPLDSGATAVPDRAGGPSENSSWHGELVVTQNVNLVVPGVSALQGALQIPSLLLLPGLLAIVAFSAVLEFAKPRPIGENPLSRLTVALSPGVWVLMILISGAVGISYALVSGRNILYVYALRDLVWLAGLSLLAGGIVGWCAYRKELARRAVAEAPLFAAEIEPLALLGQIAGEERSWRLPSKQADDTQLFLLAPGDDAKTAWACGRIDYRFVGRRDAPTMDAVRQAVADQDIDSLIAQSAAGKVVFDFSAYVVGGESITSPRIVSRSLFVKPIQDDLLVQEAI